MSNENYNEATLDLCKVARTIGCIAESNATYTRQLAERIAQYGKPLSSLTLAELVELDKQETVEFNNVNGGIYGQ